MCKCMHARCMFGAMCEHIVIVLSKGAIQEVRGDRCVSVFDGCVFRTEL